jgi:phenylacetate-coenzyme A ligase PaaK-like adenylate-forming protein
MCNRIKYPLPKNSKSCSTKDLQRTHKGAYKPAYKKYQKTAGNQPQDILPELAEIVAVWADLPLHIKATIKALVQTHTKESE